MSRDEISSGTITCNDAGRTHYTQRTPAFPFTPIKLTTFHAILCYLWSFAAATISCALVHYLFSEHPDVYTVQTEVAADGTVFRKPKLMSVTQLRRQQAGAGPRAQFDGAVHNFGRMDPLTVREHVFVIRNVGDAQLELTEGPTTCKCTLASLGQRIVPPGGKVHFVVQWNSGRDSAYAHGATIYTNDPLHKALQLSIKGTVATMFRAVPEQLVFSRITPGDAPSATAVVYSSSGMTWNSSRSSFRWTAWW